MSDLLKKRLALKIFFFLLGVMFSSWASRIPTIKSNLNINDAQLGSLLLILPISSLMGLPFSSLLVSRFDTRVPMLVSLFFLALALIGIGLSTHVYALGFFLFVFAFSMRIANISVNTQAVNLQKLFSKQITGSFHGIWAVGGVAASFITSLCLSKQLAITYHFQIVAGFTIIISIIAFNFLLKDDRTSIGNKLKIGKPDPYLLSLGLLAFLAAICEGGMYDWSGIYFKEIIKTPIYTYGFLTFIICMSVFRFAIDFIVAKIGFATSYLLCSILITVGISISISFPYFMVAIIGFALTGIGTAAMFPLTLTLAGQSKKYSAGMGISIVSTYSIVGMLLGPPLIGYIAHAANLRIAFFLFIVAGLMITPVSRFLFKNHQI